LSRHLIACIAFLLTLASAWAPARTVSYFGNEWLRDTFLTLRQRTSPEPRVLVVDIDETSAAELGPWPWPRARIADLVEILLGHYGVKGVALDIVMPEPAEAADADGDTRLALLSEHGPMVVAQAFDFQRGRPTPLREGGLGGALPGASPASAGVPASGYIGIHAGLARAKTGNIGFIPDPDGVLRHVPLITSFEGRAYPALALALIDCCGGPPPLPRPLPAQMRVGYERDWSAYTVATAAEILKHEYAADAFRDRLVIVGSTALGQGDRVATPLGGSRPGLGVQAAMLSTLLDLQTGKTPAPWPGTAAACLFALAASLLALFAFPRLAALSSVGLLAALSLAWLAFAYFAIGHDPAFVTTGPLASNLFLLAVAVPYQWQQAQHKSRELLDTLRQYVAPAVVAQLLRSDIKDPLKPRLLDVTTLIADLEGYTSHVEQLPVEEAARLTRDFLDCLTGPVIASGGTLDKYTGDGLVAFWGAPLPVAEHADLALDAARAIVAEVDRLSAARVLSGNRPLRVRIGIESGQAMAGDFGTSFRRIYTAVGDSVNTASRLEHAARDFPHDVIIGTGTVERARRHQFLLLGERLLRGKEKPTTLFTFEPDMDVAVNNARQQRAVTTDGTGPTL
jgi:adenylate cyclase